MLNAAEPIIVTLEVKVILSRQEHTLNASVGNMVKLGGSVMPVSCTHPRKALFGSEVSPVQFSRERSMYFPELFMAVFKSEI